MPQIFGSLFPKSNVTQLVCLSHGQSPKSINTILKLEPPSSREYVYKSNIKGK